MKRTGKSALLLSGAVVIAVAATMWLRVLPIKARETSVVSGVSQQVQANGTPGSPSATTTIKGGQLPPLPQPSAV